jgi:hypothetical protein
MLIVAKLIQKILIVYGVQRLCCAQSSQLMNPILSEVYLAEHKAYFSLRSTLILSSHMYE